MIRIAKAETLWAGAVFTFLALLAPSARADYAVLQSGERIHITGYEIVGPNIRLTMRGGTLEIPATDVVRIDPEDTFLPVKTKLLDIPYAKLVAASAKANGVAPELVASVISAESNFNPRAVSWRSACGLMQLLPKTAARFGVTDIFDPAQNIEAGTRYLKQLLTRFDGDLTLALAAYNAGPERIKEYRAAPPYRETQAYIRRVTDKFHEYSASSKPALSSD
ncbi:MAG: lytic transglycosylase domain-containing protein [Candidatus Acidiferrales bacterium]